VAIREVINFQLTRPKYFNPDLGSIIVDITTTVRFLFLHHRSINQTLELVKRPRALEYCE
jgi:hypothetical protein